MLRPAVLPVLTALVLAGAAAGCAEPVKPKERAMPAADRPVVGAIRWDAWHGEKGASGKAVEKSLAMSGWDRRPRQENPVPWESGAWTKSTLHYDPPRPEELAVHVRRAADRTRAHPESAEARAVLIYAWNETDEGGWLVPTLAEGAARLEAIGKALGAKPAGPGG